MSNKLPYCRKNDKSDVRHLSETDSPCSTELADRLLDEVVRIRKEKGMTQSELAQTTGIKQQAISRIETKAAGTRLKTVCAILRALNCELVVVPKKKSDR